MAVADLLAFAGFLIVLLWIGIPQNLNQAKIAPTQKIDEVELILNFQAGLLAARTTRAVILDLGLQDRLSPSLWNRVENISRKSETLGISASLLLSQLVSEIQNAKILERKWRESLAAATTASWLLLLMPFPLLLLAVSSGLPIFNWILWHPIGRVTFGLGLAVAVFSLFRINRLPLNSKSNRLPSRKLSAQQSAGVLAFAVLALIPNFWGGVFGLGLGLVVIRNWNRLRDAESLRQENQLNQIRPRVVSELAAAITAGLDWATAVQTVEMPADFLVEWRAIQQRISWGASAPAAFANTNWNQISQTVDQALRTGAPISNALFELAAHWQRGQLSESLAEIEKRAGRNTVWVTLLQLPAFILMALVPLVAASLFPLFEMFR